MLTGVRGSVDARAMDHQAVMYDDITALGDHWPLSGVVLRGPVGERTGEPNHAVLVCPQRCL